MTKVTYTSWRKASKSNSSGNCVEVAFAGWNMPGHRGTVGIRDSKQGDDGAVIELSAATWLNFLTDVKAGRLDL
jgi:Domain of unknown function (DUF397)